MNIDDELESRCPKSYMIKNLDETIMKNINDEVFGKLLEKHKPIIEDARAKTEEIYSKTKSRMRRDFWLIPLLLILVLSMGLIFELHTLSSIMFFCIIFVLPNILSGMYSTYKITYGYETVGHGLSEYFQNLETNSIDLRASDLSLVCYGLEQWIPYSYCYVLDKIERDKNNHYYHYSHFYNKDEFTKIKRSLFQFKEEEEKANEMYESLIVDAYEEFVVKKFK